MKFKVVSEFKPTGDQPEAIKQLEEGIETGERYQTLLGVTGSGKTFTVANVIEEVQRPTLVFAITKHWLPNYIPNLNSFFLKMQLSILFLITIIINLKLIFLPQILILKKIFY